MRLVETDPVLRELASGIDALYLSGHAALPPSLLEELHSAREEARELGSASQVQWGDESFQVHPSGLLRYAFRLDHPCGVIGLSPSQALPAVRVQPRAWFLHAVGVRAAVDWFSNALEPVVCPIEWSVSRLDLVLDTLGWNLQAADRVRFVCRARTRLTYEEDSSLTGFRWGSGKSGTVSARIYDKTEEIRRKGSDWWFQKWGDKNLPGERVLRVEFQVDRGLLRELSLSGLDEVLTAVPGLWGYLTDDWLSYRTPTGDGTSSRWPVAPEWCLVQEASLRDEAIGLDRTTRAARAGSLRRLLPGLRGYMSSAGAILGAADLGETTDRVIEALQKDEAETGIPFESRIRAKQLQLGIA